MKDCLASDEGGVVINLGSGTENYWRHQQPYIIEEVLLPLMMRRNLVINVDLKDDSMLASRNMIYLKADAAKVPLCDGAGNVVLCLSLLEHVEDIGAVVAEARRLCRSDGRAFFEIPADYPEHCDPIDNGSRIGNLDGWAYVLGSHFRIGNYFYIESPSKNGSATMVEALPL